MCVCVCVCVCERDTQDIGYINRATRLHVQVS